MARKSILELIAQATADIPDNVTGLVSPADVRNLVVDFLNAVAPAYGVLRRTSPNTQSIGTTDTLVVFNAREDTNPAQTTSAVPASTVTRAERGMSNININIDVECAVNREVTLTLYKDNLPTTWSVTSAGRGAGSPVGVGMIALDYSATPAVYSLRARTDAAATSVIFNNGGMVLSVLAVREFT